MNFLTGLLLTLAVGRLKLKSKAKSNNSSLLKIKRPIEVCHLIPGRIRINVPVLCRDQNTSTNLQKKLKLIDSVDKVTVSHVTGSVIVTFDDSKLEPALLVAAVIKLLGLENEMNKTPDPVLQKLLKRVSKSLDQAVYDQSNGILDLRTLVFILVALTGMSKKQQFSSFLSTGLSLMLTRGLSSRDK